jgi:hypothetical protein
MLEQINVVATYALIYGGLPAQTLYVLLYLTRPWRTYAVSRALMTKSFSFWLLLSQSFIVLSLYGLRPLDWPAWLIIYRIVGDIFMVGAIYYQLFALISEIRAGYRTRIKG